MTLKTLLGVETIGGFPVNHMETFVSPEVWEKVKTYININHADNTISFKIQNGPINEVGVNGCQIDTIIETAKLILEGLDELLPCNENKMAINYLEAALEVLKLRTAKRKGRGVEGTSQE